MARSPEDIRQDQISELLRLHNVLHRQTCEGLSQCVQTCRSRWVDVQGAIERMNADMSTGFTLVNGRVTELESRIGVVGEQTAHAHSRLDTHDAQHATYDSWFEAMWASFETYLVRLEDRFNWLLWAGIGLVTLGVSRLFWHWMLFTQNWHPWLNEEPSARFTRRRPGADYWEVRESDLLGAHTWVLAIATTVIVLGLLFMLLRSLTTVEAEQQDVVRVRRAGVPRVRRAPTPAPQPAVQNVPAPAPEPANA